MSQPENTIELMKEINKGYEQALAMISKSMKDNTDPGVVRDMLSIMKRVLKRMHRVNPEWTAMFHGYFLVDDDEMGSMRIVFATDVSVVFGGKSAPRVQLVIENIPCNPNAVAIEGAGNDQYLNNALKFSPTIVRDMLFPMNFIGHSEQRNYAVTNAEYFPGDDASVVIELHRGQRSAIRITSFVSSMFEDITQINNWRKDQHKTAEEVAQC
jgi:hypothetical protein